MTDDRPAVGDLVAWLTKILDEDEKREQQQTYIEFTSLHEQVNYKGNPRTLADIAAKRAIIAHAERWFRTSRETPEGWTEATCTAYRMAMEWTLRQLASAYADRAGYDESR